MGARFRDEDGGEPIVRRIREEFQIGKRAGPPTRGGSAQLPGRLDRRAARLTARARARRPAAPRFRASSWEFVDERSIQLLPAGTQAETAPIYELHYPAKNPRVLGIGMAATRDFVSFLRHGRADAKGTPNPAGPA